MRDWLKSEDWWSVWLGLLVVALGLGVPAGADLLGLGVAIPALITCGSVTTISGKRTDRSTPAPP
jgi:hypothetical protein